MAHKETRSRFPAQDQRAAFCYSRFKERKTKAMPSLILEKLHGRNLLPSTGYAVPLRKDLAIDAPAVAYFDGGAKLASIDEDQKVSTFLLVTYDGELDREGDDMVPSGCNTTISRYKSNPVVFYDHRENQNPALPIGISESPDKQFGLTITDTKIYAKCWHATDTPLGLDVWNLTRKKVLRGASPGFNPLQTERIGRKSLGDREQIVTPRYRFIEWEMLEWSICGIPIKPSALQLDTIKGELSAGRIKSEFFRKSFAGLTKRSWSQGAAVEKSDWDESKHPRGEGGQFGSGGGGKKPKKKPQKPSNEKPATETPSPSGEYRAPGVWADDPKAGNNSVVNGSDIPEEQARREDLVNRLDKYERSYMAQYEKKPSLNEAIAHHNAMYDSGLTGDGLINARHFAGKKPSAKPGVFIAEADYGKFDQKSKLAPGSGKAASSSKLTAKSNGDRPMPAVKKSKLPANIAAVRFLKSKFKKSAAVAWLKKHGLDTSLLEETKTVFEFAQSADADKAGARKALGGGIIAIVAKAKKAEEEEDDEDKDEDTDEELDGGKGTVKAEDMVEDEEDGEEKAEGEDGEEMDKDFDESKHKRDHGKFSSSGGSAGEKEAWTWAKQNQGFDGDFAAWQDLDDDEREEYEVGAGKSKAENEDSDADDDAVVSEVKDDSEEAAEGEEDKADDVLDTQNGPKVPNGLQSIADRCNHAMGVMKYCQSMLDERHVEKDGLVDGIKAEIEALKAQIDGYHALAAEHYPDDDFKAVLKAGGFDNEMPEEGKSDDEPDLEMPDKAKSKRPAKKLAKPAAAKGSMKKSYKACIKAAADHMGDLAAHNDIPAMHKAGLLYHAKALNDVIGAMDAPPAPDMAREPKPDDGDKQEMEKAMKAAADVTAQAKTILGDFAALATFATKTAA